ncbi:hypothetical protein P2W68_16300 [Chryseobacterium arthrosphaerae]|uniref:hypothetical protein n=1 Tax=Chryseobacterium arthrosphaerae TaxID=651561 RepID=UPI0023E1B8E9|nr:hypothetical protein [Chryseobacterium arthrosphaerae]WES96397.1 hypothetical protein P2W68_16300 [Chryseobacterium arthrosphaerae]
MKNSLSTNRYVYIYNLLITLTAAVFGYHFYHVIVHPDRSNIALSLIMAVLTSVMVRKLSSEKIRKTK